MFGFQNLLEFENQSQSQKELEDIFKEILSQKCSLINFKTLKLDKNNKFQLIFVLGNLNSLFVTFDHQQHYLLINATFYNSNKLIAYEISKIFEISCLMNFNIHNCIGTQLLKKGCDNSNQCSQLGNYNPFQSVIFKQNTIIHEEQTSYQKLSVMQNEYMGKILLLDNMIQISEKLQDNYTEYLTKEIVKPGKSDQKILIIGAGDLKIPNYILTNFVEVKQVIQCELDERVVVNSLKYFWDSEKLPHYETGRLITNYIDGAAFVREEAKKGNKYDGIIIDNTDTDLRNEVDNFIAQVLFSVNFFKNLYTLLNKGAAFVAQLTDMNNVPYFLEKVKNAGFEKAYHVICPTPEYSYNIPLGIARRMN